MIPFIEFSEIARSRGVPVSTIERDYAQNWVLKYLDDGCMTLKGGTGIRKVYVENYRFSDDLDFTLNEQMSVHKIEDNINKVKPYIKKDVETEVDPSTYGIVPVNIQNIVQDVNNGIELTEDKLNKLALDAKDEFKDSSNEAIAIAIRREIGERSSKTDAEIDALDLKKTIQERLDGK